MLRAFDVRFNQNAAKNAKLEGISGVYADPLPAFQFQQIPIAAQEGMGQFQNSS
jgi:hypothetical protein